MLSSAARRTSLRSLLGRAERVEVGYIRGGIMCKEVPENFCGGLLALSELPKILGSTYLGQGSDCLDADKWLFIAHTLQ